MACRPKLAAWENAGKRCRIELASHGSPSMGIVRFGDARHRAGKFAARHLGHAHHRSDSFADAEGFRLRHIELNADHIALHQGEQEGAAGAATGHSNAVDGNRRA